MASKFLRVRCECGTERVVFNKATRLIKCEKCGKNLLKPTGGKSIVVSKVLETLE
ncbi:MAG: 30S ribosomal protein S27e [Candidatus Aenigmarchaeota archaeon]|nr:30S ribosomal protein S27e [Candidatus Aenigmarchaeota archaeon]